MSTPLRLHADRLLPADPATRSIARHLYDAVAALPIISPHGHVPARWIAEDAPFRDPASLLITPDHYVTRLLHADGVPLPELGIGGGELDEPTARQVFTRLCERWHLFAGTPVRLWLESQLAGIFGVTVRPSAATAEEVYDAVQAWINRPTSRPRALLDSFGIEFLATTDDPCDSLTDHARIADDPSVRTRVAPTFRPDVYLEPAGAGWVEAVDRLAEAAEGDCATYAGWVVAMEDRRAHFARHGAVSTDHSHVDLGAERLDAADAERLYASARAGTATESEATALRRHMLHEMVRMASEDGLTMTLHPGVARNHHPATYRRHGADIGADVPVGIEVTRALQPALAAFGTNPRLRLVVFTMDETVFSRELAPLAGFYPSLYIGAPWWFLDAPDAIRRFRRAVTETVGFTRTSGFIDDTRAFCSIPARHDMSRRLDCGYLAELVVEHRIEEDEAVEIAQALVRDQPVRVFGL